ncbi:MAG: hypothetical protein LBI14_10420 [Treponema sp.]|jgi:hypothetical protein|nr:hypothetical protein [Treponema sp.]
MKNKLILIMVFVLCIGSLQAIELEISGGLGNFFFNQGNTDKHVDKAFEPSLQLLIRTVVSGEIGDTVFYSGGFERDSILGNRIFANTGLRFSFFSIELGPFIGVFNAKEELFNPGLSVAFGLEFPGVFFAKVGAFSSIGGISTAGTYSQRGGTLTAGFWVPNVICSLNVEIKSFTIQKESDLILKDIQTRYFFRADIFAKNNSFNFRLDIGYTSLQRSYFQITDSTDELKYLYLGLEAGYVINPLIRIFLAGEMPLFSWSVLPMKNPDKVLFQAKGGIVFSFQ